MLEFCTRNKTGRCARYATPEYRLTRVFVQNRYRSEEVIIIVLVS